MSDARFSVISIGVFDSHPLRAEAKNARPVHATTTLITAGSARILVDPSLPPPILLPRLLERSGLSAEHVTHIFLTSFEPIRRRGLHAFPAAIWLVSEREREAIGASLVTHMRVAMEGHDRELQDLLGREIATLERCQAADDSLAEGVDLFPLHGVTPGTCGLLLPTSRATVLVCGDAVASAEHLEQGKVLSSAADVRTAQESLGEAIEIADLLIPGRDNLVLNPLRRPF
jgi:hypothetical protein